MSLQGMVRLRSGDFQGLTNLQTLQLNGNPLTSLPEDVFDGLSNLEELDLSSTSLNTLPENVFDGLSSLEELNLFGSNLNTLRSDAFDGLSSLEDLSLGGNSLTRLPPDIFHGLSSLQQLFLNGNSSLACVHAVQFDGLSELTLLHMHGTQLGNIAPAHFVRWELDRLEELRLGSTRIGESALPSGTYQSVLPALDLSNFQVEDTAELSNPICLEPAASCGGAGNPLHGRTRKVADAILDALSASDCSAVTSAQLAGVSTVNLNEKDLVSLRSGDFDGLAGLRSLNLYNNWLPVLPGDVFDGLSNLRTLRLYGNALTTLPEDVFGGLSNLQFMRLNNNDLAWLPPDVFDGLSSLRDLYLDANSPLTCVHPGQFDGLPELRLLNLANTQLGNITPALPRLFPWMSDKLEELRFGDTLIGRAAVDFAAYEAVLPELDASKTYVRDTAELSVPVCGAITADADGAYHGTVRVSLDEGAVRPNRARASGASLLGDGVCGSDPAAAQHVLWTWQRSADGVAWTDAPQQPKAYGVRAAGECSFTYTPQSGDDGMYIRAYVPVNTAGVGRHDYRTAAFGPLNLRP